MTKIETVHLREVADINPKMGVPPAPDTAVAFVPMAAVDVQKGVLAPEERLFGELSKGLTPFVDGDLLIAKITPCFENGKIAQARIPHRLGVGSTEFHVVRAQPDRADPRYLLHFLRQTSVRRDGEQRMTGSAGQRRVPREFLSDIVIPLPALSQQRRIAAILDQADGMRAKRRDALARLGTLSQAIFHEMFGDPESNPRGWDVVPLADVVRAGTIVTYGIVQAGEEWENGVPYIRTGDIVNGEIVTKDLRHTAPEIADRFARSRVDSGDIVMSIRATVGTTALVPQSVAGANLTQGTARIAPGERVVGLYLLHLLRTPGIQKWIQRQVKGATFREITLGRLRELPVVVPPITVQEAFGVRCRVVEGLKRLQGESVLGSGRLFASLQHRAFRGEL